MTENLEEGVELTEQDLMNQRIEKFIAAALTGLLASGKTDFEYTVRRAISYGFRTAELMEEYKIEPGGLAGQQDYVLDL